MKMILGFMLFTMMMFSYKEISFVDQDDFCSFRIFVVPNFVVYNYDVDLKQKYVVDLK